MDVTDEDLENISAFIKSSLSINKKRIKEWQNTNNWTKIAQFINDDNANKLYQLIFGKPM